MKTIKIYLYLIFVLSLIILSACNYEKQLFPQRKIKWGDLNEPIKSELEQIILTDHDFEVVYFDSMIYKVIYEKKMHGSFSGANKFRIGEKNY